MTFVGSAMTGVVLWELINPVSMLHRGLIFGMGAAWTVVLVVFLFDLFVMSRGWCGRLCPVGAFYSLLGRWSPVRVSASARGLVTTAWIALKSAPNRRSSAPRSRVRARVSGRSFWGPTAPIVAVVLTFARSRSFIRLTLQ
jgi:hypothetical protein